MKILVLSHEYPPIGGGGGRVVRDLSRKLAKRGHIIHVLTAHWKDLPKIEDLGNLKIERLPACRTQSYRAGFFAMGAFVWRVFWRGLRAIRESKPDLIHAHFAVPAGAAAYLLNKITGIPYLITAHGGDVPGGAPEKTRKWFKFVLPFSKIIWKKASAIAAVSPETKGLARQHYLVPVQVIPNGIDTEEFKPGNRVPNKTARILYMGRFSPEKNAAAVPEVLFEIKDLPWQCLMLGDGPDMPLVRGKIKEYRLDKRISLEGWVDPDMVKKKLLESDILLLPSLREGMPIAGLQGLACGLALVLSRIGNCPELVQEGNNGYLVNPGDVKGYQKALRLILEDPEILKQFKKNSRKRSKSFDLEKTIDAYESLMKDLINSYGEKA